MLLKTRKASLQHELVCNKTLTAYDEVIIVVAIDTVNSLWSTNSNGALVHLRDSNQVNRSGQINNCKCPLNTHWCPLCKSNFCPSAISLKCKAALRVKPLYEFLEYIRTLEEA